MLVSAERALRARPRTWDGGGRAGGPSEGAGGKRGPDATTVAAAAAAAAAAALDLPTAWYPAAAAEAVAQADFGPRDARGAGVAARPPSARVISPRCLPRATWPPRSLVSELGGKVVARMPPPGSRPH